MRANTVPETNQLTQLHQQINAHFNEGELRDLCFNLKVEHDSLGGRGKADNARELVAYMERRGRLPDLMAAVKAARPHSAAIRALADYAAYFLAERQALWAKAGSSADYEKHTISTT